eukprot:12805019-Ditylum_brightwellii.AAC.1
MEKAEQQFKSSHNYTNNTPFDLEDTNINITFLAWANELKLDLPTGNKSTTKNFVNKIDQDSKEEFNKYDNIFVIQNMIQCNHCGGRHHKDIQHNLLINHLANISYLKKILKPKKQL